MKAATLAALRRRKAVEEALTTYDAAVKPCPINNPAARSRLATCPKCGATSSQGCELDASASYSLITTIRATLTETPNDQ